MKAKYQSQFNESEEGLSVSLLDNLLGENSWVCPINVITSDRAYFSIREDNIVCPLKAQFTEETSFYSTLTHEMTHSTGTEKRLNRKFGLFGDKDYAREELVAELTSALMCFMLGVTSTIKEENVMYLKGWMDVIKEEPSYLMEILSDVMSAFSFISDKIGFNIEEVATQPVLDKEKELAA